MTGEDDAISRKAVIDLFGQIKEEYPRLYTAVEFSIRMLPPVKPQEPKTGHWIGIDEEPHEDYECDKCGYVVSTFTANIEPHSEYKYCPNCGARMESEVEE